MPQCEICDKKIQTGNNLSHSHRKTKRKFKVNIITKTILISGKPVKIQICTKCYKNNRSSLLTEKL